MTGTEKTNGEKGTARFLCKPAPLHLAAFTESEANQSIIEAYGHQYHKIMGFYPCANSQKDKEAVKKALQSRPRGTTLMSETSAVMKFIETMLPGESLSKLLGRYMNKAILLSSTSKPFINADNQTRVPDPKEEAAVDTPAAAGETGRDTAPGQEYKTQGTKTPAVPENNDREALFEAVAEEYLSDAGRSRIIKDVSLSGERLKYREYLKPFMERKISSITPFEVKELLAGMHRKGCLAEEGETVYKIFCGIITKASDGKYAGFLDAEILRIDPLNLFAIFDGEKTRLPLAQERSAEQVPVVSASLLARVDIKGKSVPAENVETKEQIADLLARVNELEKKITSAPEPLKKPPDPGKYVSAREFYQVIRERGKVG